MILSLVLTVIVVGCRTTSDIKRVGLNRETIYTNKLDAATTLEVRIDEDGTARIHLVGDNRENDVLFSVLYSTVDQHVESYHALQYDRSAPGLAAGVGVVSDSGVLRTISIGEFQGTDCNIMLNRDGGYLPNRRHLFSTELGGKRTVDQITYDFVPVSQSGNN